MSNTAINSQKIFVLYVLSLKLFLLLIRDWAVCYSSAHLQRSQDRHSWKTHGIDLGHTEFCLKGTNLRASWVTDIEKKRKNLVWKRRRRRGETNGQVTSCPPQHYSSVWFFSTRVHKWQCSIAQAESDTSGRNEQQSSLKARVPS